MKRLLFITSLLLVFLSSASSEECRGECILTVSCWLSGGRSNAGSCPGFLAYSFTSWLYGCCSYHSNQLQQPFPAASSNHLSPNYLQQQQVFYPQLPHQQPPFYQVQQPFQQLPHFTQPQPGLHQPQQVFYQVPHGPQSGGAAFISAAGSPHLYNLLQQTQAVYSKPTAVVQQQHQQLPATFQQHQQQPTATFQQQHPIAAFQQHQQLRRLPTTSASSAAQLRRQPNQLFRRTDSSLQSQNKVECGVPALTLQKRIIGGSEAYFGELPWQAHIRIGGYQCGGALVSRRHVVTAAHCVHRAQLDDIVVYLGEYDTQNTDYEPLPEETHRVLQKYVHPNFQFRLAQPDRFDVALVRLARGVIFKANILPICLPKRTTSLMGKEGLVAGWGKTDTTYGKTGTNILRKAVVPILTDAECLKWHRHKNIRVELHKEMFCAGHSDGRMDACLGDSGGPLIVLENGHWTLTGITSAGFGCAVDHQPGIYHKVQFTVDWINMIIATT